MISRSCSHKMQINRGNSLMGNGVVLFARTKSTQKCAKGKTSFSFGIFFYTMEGCTHTLRFYYSLRLY